MRFMHQMIKRFLMTNTARIGPRVRAVVSAIHRFAVGIPRGRRAVRTDLMTDHQRRDIGLIDGRSTMRNAEQAADRRT